MHDSGANRGSHVGVPARTRQDHRVECESLTGRPRHLWTASTRSQGSEGWGFESFRGRHIIRHLTCGNTGQGSIFICPLWMIVCSYGARPTRTPLCGVRPAGAGSCRPVATSPDLAVSSQRPDLGLTWHPGPSDSHRNGKYLVSSRWCPGGLCFGGRGRRLVGLPSPITAPGRGGAM
jgi:hypothetical protein